MTTYLSGDQVDRAQVALDRHAVSNADGLCLECGVPGRCLAHERAAKVFVLLALRLPAAHAVSGGGNGATGTGFATRLKDLRVRRGLSLRRLGRLVHYSHGYLWDLETGGKQPTLEVASALDRALGADGALSALVAAHTTMTETAHAAPVTPALSGAVAAVTLTVAASPTGAVRVVIDTGPGRGGGHDVFAEPSSVGARVYSLAQARAARAVRVGSA